MLDRVAIDVPNTVSDVMLRDIESKTQRINRDDPKSPMEQAKNKDGVLQWLVTLSVSVKPENGGKTRHVDITATVTSPVRPFEKIPVGSFVIVEGLKMGIMSQLQSRTGYSVFYTLDSIRLAQPVQPVRTSAS